MANHFAGLALAKAGFRERATNLPRQMAPARVRVRFSTRYKSQKLSVRKRAHDGTEYAAVGQNGQTVASGMAGLKLLSP